MPQSLGKIYIHLVWHIKSTSPEIAEAHLDEVFRYIGGLVNKSGCISVIVGGMPNHIHVLCLLARTMSAADLAEELKRNSSRWIKTLDVVYENFAWQCGYGVFSVSKSAVDKVVDYIRRQREHHSVRSFESEYVRLLDSHGVDYDPRYLFTD